MTGLLRHPALQDLSRDHQRFLMEMRGVRWTVEGDSRALPAHIVRQSLAIFWEQHGEWHLKEEEEVLFPYCEECVPSLKTEFDKLRAEHAKVRAIVEAIRPLKDDDPELVRMLGEIAETINLHVRYEEKIVFERIQQVLTEAQIQTVHDNSLAYRNEHRSSDAIGPQPPKEKTTGSTPIQPRAKPAEAQAPIPDVVADKPDAPTPDTVADEPTIPATDEPSTEAKE